MTNPLKLVISPGPNGLATEHYEPMSDAEWAQAQADAAAFQAVTVADTAVKVNAATFRDALETKIALALSLADKLNANTATPAEQRQALELCLRGIVRLTRVVFRTYDQPA